MRIDHDSSSGVLSIAEPYCAWLHAIYLLLILLIEQFLEFIAVLL